MLGRRPGRAGHVSKNDPFVKITNTSCELKKVESMGFELKICHQAGAGPAAQTKRQLQKVIFPHFHAEGRIQCKF